MPRRMPRNVFNPSAKNLGISTIGTTMTSIVEDTIGEPTKEDVAIIGLEIGLQTSIPLTRVAVVIITEVVTAAIIGGRLPRQSIWSCVQPRVLC